MRRRSFRSTVLLLPSVFALLLLAACGSDPVQPVVPGVEPEILNSPDTFQFQVSLVEACSGTLNYTWTNTGALANVDQSSNVEPGQAVLTLMDADGMVVYTRDLSVDGSSATDAGLAGDWQVRVTLSGLTGTLNFRAEKRTP
jgi:hypothetical protein